MLRIVLLSSAALLVAAPAAMAQPAAGQNWSGPYIGVNLGYGGGGFSYPYAGSTGAGAPVGGEVRQASSGGGVGGQVGYNYELPGGWILGGEADIDGSSLNGATDLSSYGAGGSTRGQIKSQLDYLGTVRGRVGYAMFGGRLAPFVTGGLAYGQVTSSASYSCSACGAGDAPYASYGTDQATRTGWTVGGGTDYALTPRLSLRAEYLYVNLGRFGEGAAQFGAPGSEIVGASAATNTNANLVRVGLNYRF